MAYRRGTAGVLQAYRRGTHLDVDGCAARHVRRVGLPHVVSVGLAEAKVRPLRREEVVDRLVVYLPSAAQRSTPCTAL